MTVSLRLIDLDALVDVSNYSSLETRIIRLCQSLCNSHSSSQLAYSLSLRVCKCVHTSLFHGCHEATKAQQQSDNHNAQEHRRPSS